MAQRWTVKEDYIVCKFCQEQEYEDIECEVLDQLITRLEKAGFNSRSSTAIYKRAQTFTYLFRGWESPYATNQVLQIYQVVSSQHQMREAYQWVNRYVEEMYCQNTQANTDLNIYEADNTFANSTRLLFIDMPEVKEPFYNVFHELLKKYYEKHMSSGKKLGAVKREFKTDLARFYGVNSNTFDAIRKGKYKSITKEILYKLFFALELDYIDVKRLLESLGDDFQYSEKFDMVIKGILMCNSPRRFNVCEVNDTLNYHGLPNLF